MALLVMGLDQHIGTAQAWRDTFAEQLPALAVRIWPDTGDAGRHQISGLHASRFRRAARPSPT